MRFLADVSAALDASLDMEHTLAAVADLCVRDLGDWCSIDLTDADGELRNVVVAHVDPVKVELAQRMRERYPPRSNAPAAAPRRWSAPASRCCWPGSARSRWSRARATPSTSSSSARSA